MVQRFELTDEQWERLQPLLPPQKAKTGRPAIHHRQIINGILWILRTGAPWRALPERYGRWSTVAARFYNHYLRERGIRITIARRSNQHRGGPFNTAIYRLRNRIERLINRMKHLRRLATRYEKRAENYRIMWVIAAIMLWL